MIEGSSLINYDNDSPECVDASTSFSLASFAEAIYTTLLLIKELNFHIVFIIIDGLLSQVWYRNHHKLKNNEDWRATPQDGNQENCKIEWLLTSIG
ncbi:hypothetical protein LIER_23600 [Lithospermum erythrorhizon]|uniref:Uncharacterized protein n=1 Tax=Lithospermum erythrorhizon TaxID=34254 RepID=A0AAV3R0G1_LITER